MATGNIFSNHADNAPLAGKNRMTSLLALALAVSMIITMAGCGNNKTTPSPSEGDASGNSDGTTASASVDGSSVSNAGDSSGSDALSGTTGSGSSGGRSSVSAGTSSAVPADTLLKEKSDIVVNVRDFGAKADAANDDAPAIEKAIASIKDVGGTVYLPAGRYRMAKGILVPMGISIVGDKPATKAKWSSITAESPAKQSEASGSSWISGSNFSGTWIFVDHGKGDKDSAPTFRLQGNTTVENLGFVYPGQAPVVSSVSEYPPAIAVITTVAYKFVRDGMRIANIYLLNPYVGIAVMQYQSLDDYRVGDNDTQGGKISTGRLTIQNITGSPLWKGILIKGILDTVDMQQIRFGYSNFNQIFSKFRHNQCIDIEIARADGINLYNSFSIGASYGIKTTTAFTGASSIRASNLTIKGRIPMSFVSGMTIFSDVEATMMNYGGFCNSDTYRGIEVLQDVRCVHQPAYLFSNIKVVNAIRSASVSDIGMYISLGKAGNVSVHHSTFVNANPDSSEPVILLHKNDGSAISAHFYDTTFTNASSSGLLAQASSISSGTLQFTQCIVADNLFNALPAGTGIWFLESKLSSGGPLDLR
ncbi:MAG: glycosyl hydrolase family 28-related protein [Saccharofermentanales bacterium]